MAEETDIRKQTNASSSFEVQYLCTIFSQLCVFLIFFAGINFYVVLKAIDCGDCNTKVADTTVYCVISPKKGQFKLFSIPAPLCVHVVFVFEVCLCLASVYMHPGICVCVCLRARAHARVRLCVRVHVTGGGDT